MTKAISLRDAERPDTPNTAFFAPEGINTRAKVDGFTPVYDMSADRLFTEMISAWSALERVELVGASETQLTARFLARTALLRFRDDVDVEIVPLSEDRAGFIIYSHSRIGYSDLGANRKRVEQWLKVLNERVKGT